MKAAAKDRLLEAADPVAARLIDITLNEEDVRVALMAIRDVLDRAGVRDPREKPIDVLTLGVTEREIARLEAELKAQGRPLPPHP